MAMNAFYTLCQCQSESHSVYMSWQRDIPSLAVLETGPGPRFFRPKLQTEKKSERHEKTARSPKVTEHTLLRTTRSFGSLAAFVGTTATSWAFPARAGVAFDEVVDEFLQLCFAELAIFVRVEFQRVAQHAFGIDRRWTFTWTARPTLTTAGSAWTATFTTGTTSATSGSTAGTTRAAGSSFARSAARRAAGSGSTAALRSVFVVGQFAVFVFVERCQRCGGALDFFGRNHAVVIGVQSFNHRTRRSSTATSATRPAAGRSAASTLSAGVCGGLSNHCRRTRDDDKSKHPQPAFHGKSPEGSVGKNV